MNLSEYTGTKALIMMIPQGEIPSVWKGYATKISIMTFVLGTYFLVFRNRELPSFGKWFRKCKKKDSKENEILREKPLSERSLTYNDELCPICLSTPKYGVRAYCGHLLCATCLESYCEARDVSAPPPCPLCRAPLDSVTLAYEQESTLSLSEFAKADINPSEKTLSWIREYNRHRGQIAHRNLRYSRFFTGRKVVLLLMNFLTVFLSIELIEASWQTLPLVDWASYSSFLGIMLKLLTIITLSTCIWFKAQDEVALD